MSNLSVVAETLNDDLGQIDHNLETTSPITHSEFNADLSALITKSASKQTYYTIRYLVDRDRIADAYRAYAYFRWVDDSLDQNSLEESERIAFVMRQQSLMECGYLGDVPRDLTAEEHMLAHLIQNDHEHNSGLQAYIRNLMAVMAFDANRRGQLISEKELTEYSRLLSTAVTEAMHYFIGHDQPPPHSKARYLAVTAAHITHMLRDTFEDTAAGYFNIPREFIETHGIDPADVRSDAYREWVKCRVQLARDYFAAGKRYLAQVKTLRCRIAGYAYMARFYGVLNAIERDGYLLRPGYPEYKGLVAKLNICRSALINAVGFSAYRRFAMPF